MTKARATAPRKSSSKAGIGGLFLRASTLPTNPGSVLRALFLASILFNGFLVALQLQSLFESLLQSFGDLFLRASSLPNNPSSVLRALFPCINILLRLYCGFCSSSGSLKTFLQTFGALFLRASSLPSDPGSVLRALFPCINTLLRLSFSLFLARRLPLNQNF